MCIAVFIWNAHPLYPFLLLLNRDEYHNRPTEPLAWWGCDSQVLGGRDGLAGGTWLASTRAGRLSFVTNVREVDKFPEAKSRGDLPLRFLQSKKDPKEFAEELIKEADQYNGFNLVVADLCSRNMVYITNRPKGDNVSFTEVTSGIHVLSNASLDSPWPKAERLRYGFKDVLDTYGAREVLAEEIIEKLMRDTVKDDESLLPHIYPVEREYHLSSIFVEEETPLGRYGTRSISALYVKANGEVCFHEQFLEKGSWSGRTMTYRIEKMN